MLYDMKYGSLILEKKEYVYLKRILNVSAYASDFEVQRSLLKLSEELKSAQKIYLFLVHRSHLIRLS